MALALGGQSLLPTAIPAATAERLASPNSAPAAAIHSSTAPAVPSAPEGNSARKGREVARRAVAVAAWIRGNGVYGAGIAISEQHVLTCAHVVQRMKSIRVAVGEGEFRPARIAAQDAALDLAVLRVEGRNQAYARFASASSMEMSDPVFAIGNPRNMSSSLARGIVSYAGRPYGGLFYLQTDVATNGGNSGGPLLNERGEVVGIASFVLRNSEGLSFALPIDYAHRRFPEYFAERLDLTPFQGWLAERHTRAHSQVPAGVPALGRD